MCHGLPEGYGGGVSITNIFLLLLMLNRYSLSFSQSARVTCSVWWSHLFSSILGLNLEKGVSDSLCGLVSMPEFGERWISRESLGAVEEAKPSEPEVEATLVPTPAGDLSARFILIPIRLGDAKNCLGSAFSANEISLAFAGFRLHLSRANPSNGVSAALLKDGKVVEIGNGLYLSASGQIFNIQERIAESEGRVGPGQYSSSSRSDEGLRNYSSSK